MEAVCILLGHKPDWDSAKKLLGMPDFMEQLVKYDKDNIDPKKIKQLQKYVTKEDFNPTDVGKVSNAAKGLCMWCCAMDTYNRVAKDVEPKKAKHAEGLSFENAPSASLCPCVCSQSHPISLMSPISSEQRNAFMLAHIPVLLLPIDMQRLSRCRDLVLLEICC